VDVTPILGDAKMSTYQEYQEQIAKLQALAEQARRDEISKAKKRIRDLMEANGLTAYDLQEQKQKQKRPGAVKKQSSLAIKYKDPNSGQTWTGRGRPPRWLDGKNKDEYLIK
jgi:DNA-binding protein H-NS